MTTITNNKRLFQTASKNYNLPELKNLSRFLQNLGNQSQNGYQNKNTGQYQKISTTAKIQNIQMERDINGQFR